MLRNTLRNRKSYALDAVHRDTYPSAPVSEGMFGALLRAKKIPIIEGREIRL